MTTKRNLAVTMLIGVLAVSVLGCATGSSTAKAVAPGDVKSLAGTWNGTVTGPGGKPISGVELQVSSDGTYTMLGGGFTSRGTFQVKDGKLMSTSTYTSGGVATGQRTAVTELSERAGGVQVLSGMGHADVGPFSYEFTRRK